MDQAKQPGPITKPSLRYFMPYRQTIVGCILVALVVALLVVGIQLLVRG